MALGGWPIISGFFTSLTAQIARPPQIESITASLMWLIGQFGNPLTAKVEPRYMSIDLLFINPLTWWPVLWLIKLLPLALTVYLGIKTINQKNSTSYRSLLFYQLSLLLITSLLIAYNVMSPQYLIWLWAPFGFWMVTAIQSKLVSRLQLIFYSGLILIIHLLTTLILTYYSINKITDLLNLNPIPMSLIGFRNLLIIGFWWLVYRRLVILEKIIRSK